MKRNNIAWDVKKAEKALKKAGCYCYTIDSRIFVSVSKIPFYEVEELTGYTKNQIKRYIDK